MFARWVQQHQARAATPFLPTSINPVYRGVKITSEYRNIGHGSPTTPGICDDKVNPGSGFHFLLSLFTAESIIRALTRTLFRCCTAPFKVCQNRRDCIIGTSSVRAATDPSTTARLQTANGKAPAPIACTSHQTSHDCDPARSDIWLPRVWNLNLDAVSPELNGVHQVVRARLFSPAQDNYSSRVKHIGRLTRVRSRRE